MSLPRLMLAPNGATRGKADHPALPVRLPEVLRATRDAVAAGADGLHLHLRDDAGGHLLDSGAYREALAEAARHLPGLPVQITTEAAGRYGPGHQRHVALHSGARLVSVALREMLVEAEAAPRFYAEAAERGIAVQHILYEAGELALLAAQLPPDRLRDPALQMIFVLGRYTAGQVSAPAMLRPFLEALADLHLDPDWACCAFGPGETACLVEAAQAGGKCRVGFENALVHPDGRPARDNAARVAEVRAALDAAGCLR